MKDRLLENLLNTLKYALCPPGSGVYTVHTGKSKREYLQQKLYQETQTDKVNQAWEKSLDNIQQNIPVILGIPSDAGGGILRGANWGPLFIRESFYQAYQDIRCFELGDVRVIPQLLTDDLLNQQTIDKCRKALYGDEKINYPVSPLSIAYDMTKDIYNIYPDKKILSLGGDHSASYPVIKSYLEKQKIKHTRAAIIHFDAHTDLLDSRLGIDICFGTWAYHILPDLNKPSDLIQIGIRASAHDKKYWENKLGLTQYWSKEVKSKGAEMIAAKIIQYLHREQIQEVYITFDIDALDELEVGATGTPEPDGLSLEDSLIIINAIAANVFVTGADIMEVAPFIKTHSNSNDKTLQCAATLFAKFLALLNQQA